MNLTHSFDRYKARNTTEMSLEKPSPADQSSGVVVPPTGDTMSLSPLDGSEERVQPFPRSPQLQRRLAKAAIPTQEQLTKRMEELRVEKHKTEARIQSLKKRRADLTTRTEVMKQQIHTRFEAMRSVLNQDEQALMESLDIDLKKTRTMLDHVLKTWNQHLDQVSKTINSTQKTLRERPKSVDDMDTQVKKENISLKRPETSEKTIRLNEDRFEKLGQMLSSFSKHLKVQLQRKTLLLDLTPVVIDPLTSHNHLTLTSDFRGLFYTPSSPLPERPLQFDRVYCALGSSPLSSPQSYWEVDVRCCTSWAVGVTYDRLDRKGRDKASKLGRNRNSWCVELRNGQLSAWHNDRHLLCQGVGQARVRRVGVWVQLEKGRVVFYDADSMGVLQSFSAAMTPVFDRAHHQFTEPLFPAVRLIKPETQVWPNHMEFCHTPFSF